MKNSELIDFWSCFNATSFSKIRSRKLELLKFFWVPFLLIIPYFDSPQRCNNPFSIFWTGQWAPLFVVNNRVKTKEKYWQSLAKVLQNCSIQLALKPYLCSSDCRADFLLGLQCTFIQIDLHRQTNLYLSHYNLSLLHQESSVLYLLYLNITFQIHMLNEIATEIFEKSSQRPCSHLLVNLHLGYNTFCFSNLPLLVTTYALKFTPSYDQPNLFTRLCRWSRCVFWDKKLTQMWLASVLISCLDTSFLHPTVHLFFHSTKKYRFLRKTKIHQTFSKQKIFLFQRSTNAAFQSTINAFFTIQWWSSHQHSYNGQPQ